MIIEKRKHFNWISFSHPNKIPFRWNQIFLQSPQPYKHPYYSQLAFSSLTIDLCTDYYNRFDKGLKYKIRRAEKDQLIYNTSLDVNPIAELFQYTIHAKSLNTLNVQNLIQQQDYIVTTATDIEQETLAAHYYLLDKMQHKVLLRYNASAYRKYNVSHKRQACGRANRWLFLQDFRFFAQKGFEVYDFGGYDPQSKDEMILGVNTLKEEFNGNTVKQYNFYPMIYRWGKLIMGS